ncbi:hypothetical protein Pmar_PMAR011172 [Perkinsus marinus ATCC 50983]|uniref:Uncharacterized protein n=1 Tax=Perkinsus marinus (strain ATCC 50983 / TXsc) TaxID=423536 RepID=C5L1P1_PERM5|nr:hypothetical protein Pmar_PMAR011172 [Perkinsus marinus ATCC 50983]EER09353.1 hypothetical protein Pmar_PMAR011172 [Perkinsus marinus ATCC 50983]|eukprot:XP_002777537.1 hypothetical protein Pmar_PMAR011172 [Perkinsus marinus ATCC 50983]
MASFKGQASSLLLGASEDGFCVYDVVNGCTVQCDTAGLPLGAMVDAAFLPSGGGLRTLFVLNAMKPEVCVYSLTSTQRYTKFCVTANGDSSAGVGYLVQIHNTGIGCSLDAATYWLAISMEISAYGTWEVPLLIKLVAAKFEGSVRASIPKCTTHGDIGGAGEFDQQSEEVLALAAYQGDSDAGYVLSGGSAGSIIMCPDRPAGVKKIRGCPTERLYALTSGRALIVIDIEADFLHSKWDKVDSVDLSASGGGGAVPTAVALVCDDEECLVLFGEETGVVGLSLYIEYGEMRQTAI